VAIVGYLYLGRIGRLSTVIGFTDPFHRVPVGFPVTSERPIVIICDSAPAVSVAGFFGFRPFGQQRIPFSQDPGRPVPYP
jgi:hypothetical protein